MTGTIAEATGQCHCGAVRYRAFGVSDHMETCHCGYCRKFAAGPMMTRAAQRIEFLDETSLGRYASSDWGERVFCRTCGSSIAWCMRDGSFVGLAAYTLDAQPVALVKEIFIDHKPDGYAFADVPEQMTEADVIAWATQNFPGAADVVDQATKQGGEG